MSNILKLFPYMLYMWLLPRYSNCCLSIAKMLQYTLLPMIERMLKRAWECLYAEHEDTWCLLQAETHEAHISAGHVCTPMCGYYNPDKCDCAYCTLKGIDLNDYIADQLLFWIKSHQGMPIQGYYASVHVPDADMYVAIAWLLKRHYIEGPSVDDVTTHDDMCYYSWDYRTSEQAMV